MGEATVLAVDVVEYVLYGLLLLKSDRGRMAGEHHIEKRRARSGKAEQKYQVASVIYCF